MKIDNAEKTLSLFKCFLYKSHVQKRNSLPNKRSETYQHVYSVCHASKRVNKVDASLFICLFVQHHSLELILVRFLLIKPLKRGNKIDKEIVEKIWRFGHYSYVIKGVSFKKGVYGIFYEMLLILLSAVCLHTRKIWYHEENGWLSYANYQCLSYELLCPNIWHQ